jgi:DNA polymerase-3 subunit delta'
MPFRDIQGQAAAVEQLKRAWQNHRLPHALLFTGPDGVGKRTVALALAQALNCKSPSLDDACGECLACRKTAQGIHPDVRVLEPDGAHIKIEQIRETLQHDAVLKPMEGERKVYILDPADSLTLGAANSLLKILEEPPSAVMLVLVTAQPFALLDTIRSRCREIRFFPLTAQRLAPWLRMRLGVDEAAAQALARLSGGRPAEALRLSEPERRELRNTILAWAQNVGPQSWSEWARTLGEYQDDLTDVFDILLSWYRDLLLAVNRGPQTLWMNVDHAEAVKQALVRETPETLLDKCRALLAARDQLSRNANVQLVLEVLGMTMTQAVGAAVPRR